MQTININYNDAAEVKKADAEVKKADVALKQAELKEKEFELLKKNGSQRMIYAKLLVEYYVLLSDLRLSGYVWKLY